jgi:hypothetical protein
MLISAFCLLSAYFFMVKLYKNENNINSLCLQLLQSQRSASMIYSVQIIIEYFDCIIWVTFFFLLAKLEMFTVARLCHILSLF